MPYYVYRITPPKKLDHLETMQKYQEAKKLVRELRTELGPDSVNNVRMIFAKSQGEAEKLLSMPREERVIGED